MSSHQFTKEYPELGTVLYSVNPNAKRVILRVKTDGTVMVSMPSLRSEKGAEEFLLSRKNWIKEMKKKMLLKVGPKKMYINDLEKVTHFHSLKFNSHNQGHKLFMRVSNNAIIITHPENIQRDNEQIQELVRKGILIALRKEAVTHLKPRLEFFSQKFNLPFNSLSFKDNKTNWGSCSGRNNINLNIHIMRLPNHLQDYVLLHELAHIKHKDHSPAFHQFLSNMLGADSKALSRELSRFRTAI